MEEGAIPAAIRVEGSVLLTRAVYKCIVSFHGCEKSLKKKGAEPKYLPSWVAK